MNGCDSWGPEGCLDTKISQIDWCHMRHMTLNVILWQFCLKNCFSLKKLKSVWGKKNIFKFWNTLYFQTNLKSIFTYQNGLESKKCLQNTSEAALFEAVKNLTVPFFVSTSFWRKNEIIFLGGCSPLALWQNCCQSRDKKSKIICTVQDPKILNLKYSFYTCYVGHKWGGGGKVRWLLAKSPYISFFFKHPLISLDLPTKQPIKETMCRCCAAHRLTTCTIRLSKYLNWLSECCID
jgi:hypothetical protein